MTASSYAHTPRERLSKQRRRKPNRTEREASALLQIKRGDQWLIPEPLRSTGDAKAICAYVTYHHNVEHAIGGTLAPQNLEPLAEHVHDEITAKKSIPAIAKAKRLSKAQEEFRRKMLAKSDQADSERVRGQAEPPPDSRPMHGSRRSKWKHKFRGGWERRT